MILTKRISKLLLFIFMVSGLMFSAVTQAEAAKDDDIFDRFIKPIPEIPLMSEEDFIKATKPVKKTPYGDNSLAYTIRISKDWEEKDDKSSSNFVLNEKLFLDLSVFYGKPTPQGRSRLEVQAINMEGILTAEQWYLNYILESGFTTEGFVVHDENSVESLMVTMEQDTSYYLRSRVMLNGNKIIMVRYFVPVVFIQDEAPMQAQVLQSFSLSNLVERQPIEMEMYRFLDIAELRHPKGWQVFAKPIKNVDRLSATVVKVKEVANSYGVVSSSATEAKLDVGLVAASPKSTLVQEVDNYKKKVELNGVLVGDKLENDFEFEYDEAVDFGLTEVYEGIDSGNNLSEHEFWFTIIVAGNYYTFLMLLTPSRNERFGVWAENTQNYKEIIRQFKPMAGAFLERD